MRPFKIIILTGAGLLLFLTGISFLLPKTVSIARSAEIMHGGDCPKELIGNLAEWQDWFPALKNGSATMHIVNNDSARITVSNGHIMDVAFKTRTQDSLIVILSGGATDFSKISFLIENQNNVKTRVDLIADNTLGGFPWNRFKGIFLDKFAGPQYENALENIKMACEKTE